LAALITVPGGNSFAEEGTENAKADASNDAATKPPKYRTPSQLFVSLTATCGAAHLKLLITSSDLITLLLELQFHHDHRK
jgi:hypothetical protein